MSHVETMTPPVRYKCADHRLPGLKEQAIDRLGAPNTNRTCDLPLRRGLLYPLSYRGARPIVRERCRIMALRSGCITVSFPPREAVIADVGRSSLALLRECECSKLHPSRSAI